MDGFLSWFFAFLYEMLGGIWRILEGIFQGFIQIFNLPAYFEQFSKFSNSFTLIDWVLSIIAFILVFAIWALIIFAIVLGIRKYIRFRKSLVSSEDLLEELSDLHRDVIRLTKERERIMAMKLGNESIPVEELNRIFAETDSKAGLLGDGDDGEDKNAIDPTAVRFFRLKAVDEKYQHYVEPIYDDTFTLESLCDTFRNFACSRMHLFYEKKTIRLMFAGLASTKMILLQGISGTGKTSLPYSIGKWLKNDATIASVQPSWRDRTELFGYFNEFTKKFNETEFLKRIYEASYNDDINIVVLDEMNIARVEYYFAEMLSILEMPDPSEWKIELVTNMWPTDPEHLYDGKLTIPQNVWYVGTANNDDSTFAVSDKVYDRAFTINLDSKGMPFDAPDTPNAEISYSFVDGLYKEAQKNFPIEQKYLDYIADLDLYVIEHFRVAFGNRIMKQLHLFVPVYVACGGDVVSGIDYMLATKVFRKFEALNLSLIRDEIDGLVDYMAELFGEGAMAECNAYLARLKKMY